jgi:MFS family permease
VRAIVKLMALALKLGALKPGEREALSSIALAIALIALVGVGLSLSLPLLSVEMERMGVSGSGIGASVALAAVASIVTVPFVPGLAARIGLGRVIALALALTMTSLMLFPLIYDYWAWFVFRFMLSVGLSTLFVLSEYWIASTAPPDRRGIVMGVYATILALGFAAGPGLLALVGTVGLKPYLVAFGLFAAACVPLWYARHWLPLLDRAPQHALRHYMFAVPLASAAGFASGAIEIGGISLLPVFGLHRGLAPESATLLVSCVALGNVVSQIPIGLLSDRISKATLLGLIAATGLVATLAIPSAATLGPKALYALLFVWGGIAGGLYTVGLAHLAAKYSGADLAGGNAAFVVLFGLGPLAGPPIVGAAMDFSRSHGFSSGMALFFALVLAVALLPLLGKREIDRG